MKMENLNNQHNKDLPKNIRDYLIERKISPYAIDNWGIEYVVFCGQAPSQIA